MKQLKTWLLGTLFSALLYANAEKNVAYIHGDIAEDGTMPSGVAEAYDQMLLTDSGNKGCSQFKAMVEAEGYTISQHYDQTTTLNATFLDSFNVVVFGLHQKVWSTSEQTALDAWLQEGGGILMYSDSAAGGKYNVVGIGNPTGQNAVNSILANYGMQVAVDQGGGIRAYTPDADSPNPIIWDRPVFEGEGVSPVAIDPAGNAQALIPFDDAHKVSGSSMNPGTSGITIPSPEWAAIAHCPVGKGNIVAIFDRQPMWNNGPGSDINEEDNKEILRRIIRYLARDYGNSSEWINLKSANQLELTYRQWAGGTGTNGINYVAKNTRIATEHATNLFSNDWNSVSNHIVQISTIPESAETEIVTVRYLPDMENTAGYTRIAIIPYTNSPPPSSGIIAVNCGGTAYTGTDGIEYLADAYYVGGHTDNKPGTPVANTIDDAVYNEARSNFSAYNIPLANGNYTVRLKFAETYWTAANLRVFDISIEGVLLIDDLDLYATAPGKWVAYDLEFPIEVTDNMLNITATSSINHALLNAIVIIPD